VLTTRSHNVLKVDLLSNRRIGVSNCEASAIVRHTKYRANRYWTHLDDLTLIHD
jgi:hypothetical protein